MLVNRVWLAHFGTPLVRTPSDFGLRSEPPTHPELLDYLAPAFMEHGWSLKWLHRQIVLSATYQQASDDRAECRAIDPENVWLWRMNRRRLDFESTRDALLAVAGRLDATLGGPPIKDIARSGRHAPHAVRLHRPAEPAGPVPHVRLSESRRHQSRAHRRRPMPQQALFFMNNPLVQASGQASASAAGRGRRRRTRPQKIRRLFRVAFGRDAGRRTSRAWAQEFVGQRRRTRPRWQELAQGLLLAERVCVCRLTVK